MEAGVIAALRRGEADALREPRPSPADARKQLAEELAAARTHLRTVHDHYWQPGWRRKHRGGGVYPEQHLWDAVHGYLDLLAALERADNGRDDGHRLRLVRDEPDAPQ